MLDKAVVPGADCDSVEEDRNDADMALKFADRSADFNDSALNPIGLGLWDWEQNPKGEPNGAPGRTPSSDSGLHNVDGIWQSQAETRKRDLPRFQYALLHFLLLHHPSPVGLTALLLFNNSNALQHFYSLLT